MKEPKYIKLYACCIPVKGYSRSTICDVQKGQYKLIPNTMFEIITLHNNKTIEEIKKTYTNSYDKIIDEYIEFLLKNELAFLTDEPELFPKIDLNWESTSIISNAIIDIDSISNHDFHVVFSSLDDLNCKAVQLRFFSVISIIELEKILEHSKTGKLRTIELLLSYNDSIDSSEIEKMCKKYQRISEVVIHSSPFNSTANILENIGGVFLTFLSEKILANSHCGQIHPSNFNTNIQMFTESQKHNTCLNGKISIDINGDIKNCPSMSKTYGKLDNIKLKDVVEKPEFKDLWFINKEQVEVCKDCEFRHICTDCRAYIQDADNIYSKPIKCGYNPYINKWEDS